MTEKKKPLRKKATWLLNLLQCRQNPQSTSKTNMEMAHLQYLPATSHHCTSTQQVSTLSLIITCFMPFSCHTTSNKALPSLHAHSKISHWLQGAAFTPSYNVLLLPQTDDLFLSDYLHEVFIWYRSSRTQIYTWNRESQKFICFPNLGRKENLFHLNPLDSLSIEEALPFWRLCAVPPVTTSTLELVWAHVVTCFDFAFCSSSHMAHLQTMVHH